MSERFRMPRYELYGNRDSNFGQALDMLVKSFNPKVKRVYYPGSNRDNTPSLVDGLKQSTIIYADPYRPAVNTMGRAGYKMYGIGAERFNPGKVDLLIFEGFYDPKPLEFVREGGYVITQDWRRMDYAEFLGLNKNFEIAGLVRRSANGAMFVDKDHPEDYLKKVDSEEEWETKDPRNYLTIKNNIEWNNIETDNLFDGYKKLAELAGRSPDDPTLRFALPPKKNAEYVIYRKKSPTNLQTQARSI